MTVPASGGGPAPAAAEPVLDAEGHFHATDLPVDLSDYRGEDWGTLLVFWGLALVVFYQFFTRYVLGSSAAWTEEIARYLLIVVCFVGASMGIRRNSHIHVEFVYRFVPAPVARVLSTCVDLVRLAFLAYATALAALLVPRMQNLQMTVVDLPMSYVYGLVALGFALMTYRAVVLTVVHWRRGWSVLERPETGAA